ncbi:equilibrative nucleoside transporter 2 isoform X1 [Lepisosteus oculatus]
MARKDTPTDRGRIVGVIFFILGLGTLLPWNFFLTATEYFQRRLRHEVNESAWANGTVPLQKEYHFNNWMTLLSQLPLLLFTFLNSFLYQWIAEKVRIAGSLVFILILFALTAALVKVPMEQDQFFSVTMATIWFINSFGAVLQGSLFGLVGILPQRYSAVFMSGQALAGTFAALAMLMAIASEADRETAALGYFITPCVGTLVTLVSYLALPHLEFARFYFSAGGPKTYELESNDELLRTENGPTENGKPDGQARLALENGPPGPAKKSSVIQVFKKIKVMALCVTLVFTITLSVFPAVTADVKTLYPGKWEAYFIPVCCFLTFNLMDWIGRSIPSVVQWPPKESRLFPALVAARLLFVPLLVLCNVQARARLPVWFAHDALFTAIMVLFSLSNGYCVCLSMSYAPQMVEPQDAETAGALMTFFLALGLSLGAALSFPLRFLV